MLVFKSKSFTLRIEDKPSRVIISIALLLVILDGHIPELFMY